MPEQSVEELELLLEQAKRGTNRTLYQCLRNCFVNTQLWKKGKSYDLPEKMVKDPKNFRLLGVTEEEEEELQNTEYEEEWSNKQKPAINPIGKYWCLKCGVFHREEPDKNGHLPKVAKNHKKYRGPDTARV